jgi:hypothetical protein
VLARRFWLAGELLGAEQVRHKLGVNATSGDWLFDVGVPRKVRPYSVSRPKIRRCTRSVFYATFALRKEPAVAADRLAAPIARAGPKGLHSRVGFA